MRTKGSSWPTGFTTRLDRDLPLQEVICEHLDLSPGAPAEILDVASGRMTWIGKKWAGHKINIAPVDMRANLYEKLLAKYQISPLESCTRSESPGQAEVPYRGKSHDDPKRL
jgi:hypothetical protein